MEQFKIENFKKENNQIDFPWFVTVSGSELGSLQEKIFELFYSNFGIHLPESIDRLQLVEQKGCKISAESSGFNLKDAFKDFDLSPVEEVCVNWYRFDRIDKLKFQDLCEYFDYIWYPGSDDIELFDETLSWMVSISHDGYIALKFKMG